MIISICRHPRKLRFALRRLFYINAHAPLRRLQLPSLPAARYPLAHQYKKAAAAKIPRIPNSLTTADGDERGPSGTMSTRNQP